MQHHGQFLMRRILFMGMLLLTACSNKKDREIWGYIPIYASKNDLKNIYSTSPQPIVLAGKIYRYGQYLFQVELGKGIHVIDATQRNAPLKISFMHIPGCSELSIRQNKLYTNNYRDLVSIDISQPQQVLVLHRIENIFPGVSQEYPAQSGAWFECPDPAKGTVIAWTEKLIKNPKCQRP
jgi:hypothetical protein